MSTLVFEPTVTLEPIIYPESDGQPMADNTKQFDWIVLIKCGLEALFKDRADVFVAGDLLWYPVEGQNTIRRAPDAMVAFGRPKGPRGSYLQWLEDNLAPQVVFEVLSPGNTKREMAEKLIWYQRYGVEEYYVYDPDKGELQGWLRQRGQLQVISSMRGWVSPRLGIRFDLVGLDLALYAPDGQLFESYTEIKVRADVAESWAKAELEARSEAETRADEAETWAEAEAKARHDAEVRARAAETKANIEAEARAQAEMRAQSEAEARSQAEMRAQSEAEARSQAEMRVQELEAKLKQLGLL